MVSLLDTPAVHTSGTTRSYSPYYIAVSPSLRNIQVITAQASPGIEDLDIEDLFAAVREYGRQHHQSVLELIAEYALEDLPPRIAQTISDYLAERIPKAVPGEIKHRAFFASGRSDISERMEEIIYGSDSDEHD
jgi:hypothetical protein